MTGGILVWKLSPSVVQPSAHNLLGSGTYTLCVIRLCRHKMLPAHAFLFHRLSTTGLTGTAST